MIVYDQQFFTIDWIVVVAQDTYLLYVNDKIWYQLTLILYKVDFEYFTHVLYKSQLLLLRKVEYNGGPIFKVVLEC